MGVTGRLLPVTTDSISLPVGSTGTSFNEVRRRACRQQAQPLSRSLRVQMVVSWQLARFLSLEFEARRFGKCYWLRAAI